MSASHEETCSDCGEKLLVEDGNRWEATSGVMHVAAACLRRVKRDLEIARALCADGSTIINELREKVRTRDLRIVKLEVALTEVLHTPIDKRRCREILAMLKEKIA